MESMTKKGTGIFQDCMQLLGILLYPVVTFMLVVALVQLTGCGTTKTSNYNFNQGVPQQDLVASHQQARGLSDAPTNAGGTGEKATNSGGSGNTIILIESTNQDAKSDQDFSGLIDSAIEKLKNGLPDIGSLVPSPTEPGALDDEPAAVSPGGQGEFEEID